MKGLMSVDNSGILLKHVFIDKLCNSKTEIPTNLKLVYCELKQWSIDKPISAKGVMSSVLFDRIWADSPTSRLQKTWCQWSRTWSSRRMRWRSQRWPPLNLQRVSTPVFLACNGGGVLVRTIENQQRTEHGPFRVRQSVIRHVFFPSSCKLTFLKM